MNRMARGLRASTARRNMLKLMRSSAVIPSFLRMALFISSGAWSSGSFISVSLNIFFHLIQWARDLMGTTIFGCRLFRLNAKHRTQRTLEFPVGRREHPFHLAANQAAHGNARVLVVYFRVAVFKPVAGHADAARLVDHRHVNRHAVAQMLQSHGLQLYDEWLYILV